MKRVAFLILILLCLGGSFAPAQEINAAEAHSSEAAHGESGWDIVKIWGSRLANFAALAAILYFFLTRSLKVQDHFKEDYHQIQRSIESARQAKEEAERRLAELDERMARVGDEIAALKSSAMKEAEEEKNRILESAHREAERMLETAHKEIDSEVEAARQELRKQVADLAVKQSRQIIQAEMDEKDQKQLIKDYIEGFGK